jgi:hypothetical protein
VRAPETHPFALSAIFPENIWTGLANARKLRLRRTG